MKNSFHGHNVLDTLLYIKKVFLECACLIIFGVYWCLFRPYFFHIWCLCYILHM